MGHRGLKQHTPQRLEKATESPDFTCSHNLWPDAGIEGIPVNGLPFPERVGCRKQKMHIVIGRGKPFGWPNICNIPHREYPVPAENIFSHCKNIS